MRYQLPVIAGMGALFLSSYATADAGADIRAAEAAWSAAILAKDQVALDRYTAPEFELTGGEAGAADSIPRAAWMANLQRMTFVKYDTKVTHVHLAGDVAIATVAGSWTVEMNGHKASEPFLLRDVWARRPAGWQVVSRYRIDQAPQPRR